MTTFTSSGGILFNNENKVYMIRKITRDEWSLPKGTVEEGENLLETAIREIKEETGYKEFTPRDEKPIETIFYKMQNPQTGETVNKTVHFFVFNLISEKFSPTLEMSAEQLEGGWFTIDEAINIAKFNDVKKVLNKVKYGLN
ncbi:hypothetical protein A2380_03820 [candidate division WWE3 bacterium RIFOXYB1_FULL_43_24]|uniref:NUDIX hydrolase n=2 Tax=Katanobacteria TaxID=422282 RepID=A0A0G0YR41_UNCKA|nr:MAG: NUDIX hydrolase [candidate division WWE3 bacterium GW2011_GWA1_42_12]KKS35007.1 MAG: NUDIX hydrolase [candidate division WWE3 bacterium GW2011_GWD1_42_14]KKS39095.1 MAG: NUDIX hydrolase [candidate division WWE3 bacterium GW2011_GWF1_42_14]KKS40625.1 MAG: NUDIX hydrolase [candidate division WWE3 bacterium GW2011_GWE1_42_16]KKS67003.1 MAG: NUDIX hydrolase [candidate division WWE3 bacterium GW2011_GWB1_42_6]OGC59833.1 MAG: hypothetical protein A2212_00045 [candidate division WWE3 bacteriu